MSLEQSPARSAEHPLEHRVVFTIAEFCAVNHISRTRHFQFWQQGRGPRYFLNGKRRLITAESAAAWRRDMEAAATAGMQS